MTINEQYEELAARTLTCAADDCGCIDHPDGAPEGVACNCNPSPVHADGQPHRCRQCGAPMLSLAEHDASKRNSTRTRYDA